MDSDSITINGVEYVPASSITDGTDHQIIIVANGWIFIGYVREDDKGITIKEPSVVRSWSNGRGIGALASAEYKADYKLDKVYGSVHVPFESIRARIDCGW